MKWFLIVLLSVGVAGCAKIQVETVKPIKVDINMRVDVYQHVVNDVESINNEIYGSGDQSFDFLFGIRNVYAADLSSRAQEAIARRKKRLSELQGYFKLGVIGVNRNALLEEVGEISPQIQALIAAENKDRTIMQEEVAKKNNTNLRAVQRVFFEDEYERAPKGYYFEIYDIVKDKYVWTRK